MSKYFEACRAILCHTGIKYLLRVSVFEQRSCSGGTGVLRGVAFILPNTVGNRSALNIACAIFTGFAIASGEEEGHDQHAWTGSS